MRFCAAARPTSLLCALMLLSACAGTAPRTDSPALAPAMAIERFLGAANQNDLDTMASLFGTREGSVQKRWPKKEADDRMFLLASVLRHSDYVIGPEQIVPGRREEATQFVVRIVTPQTSAQVPFLLVRAQNRWLIEDIGIVSVTRSGGNR